MTLKNFGIKYGPFIATGIGLGGMWTSSILMAKKTMEMKDKEHRGEEKIELDPKHRLKKYLKTYALPLGLGVVSSGLILGASIYSAKTNSLLLAGYESLRMSFNKMSKKIDEKGMSSIEIKKEIMDECPDLVIPDESDTAGEDVLILDLYREECLGDGFITISRAKFWKAVCELYYWGSHFDVTLNDFYDLLEIPKVPDEQGRKGWVFNPIYGLKSNFDGSIKIDLVKGHLDNGELFYTINYITPPEELY